MALNSPDKTTNLYDIYDIEFHPFWTTRPFLIIALLCVSSLVMLVAWYWLARRKKERTLLPWEQAMNALHTIAKQFEKGAVSGNDSYFLLTMIIKEYLQVRFGVPMEEKTDDESIAALSHISIVPELRQQLVDIFSKAAMIKFARYPVSAEQLHKDIARAQEVVLQTKIEHKDDKDTQK
jgi:hypothetical protein